MGTTLRCDQCQTEFPLNYTRNVGMVWQPVYAVNCPNCGKETRIRVGDYKVDIDRCISNIVDPGPAARASTPIAERVKVNKVREYWVQGYITANFTRLGFQELKGPFESGPDFQVRRQRGKWVYAE